MSKKNLKIGVYIILIFALMLCCAVFGTIFKNEGAQAANVLTVAQKDKVFYKGSSYIDSSGKFKLENDKNELYEALEFKLDGVVTTNIQINNLTVKGVGDITFPNKYNLTLDAIIGGKSYNDINFDVVIDKKLIEVHLLLNTETEKSVDRLEINEGTLYFAEIKYKGFVGDDSEDGLAYKPTVPPLPKRPIFNYELRAKNASSSKYNFVYISAFITINSMPKEEFSLYDDEELLLSIKGDFNPYAELEFSNVGINKTSVKYASVDDKVQKFYKGNEILKKYEAIGCYSINLIIDGNKEENVPTSVTVKMSAEMQNHKEFLVIQITNDGIYNVSAAVNKEGYLVFETSDLGDFVIYSPIKGINSTYIAIGIVGGVAVLLVVIIFVALFRKKY